jgi:hypothetical protein
LVGETPEEVLFRAHTPSAQRITANAQEMWLSVSRVKRLTAQAEHDEAKGDARLGRL